MSNGSIEKENIEVPNTPENKKLIEEMIEELTQGGWNWLTDYYVDWTDPIEIQIYHDKVRTVVKQFLLEKLT